MNTQQAETTTKPVLARVPSIDSIKSMATSVTLNNKEETLDPQECPPQQRRVVGWATATRRFFMGIEFKNVKIAQLLCGIYILVVTFTYTGQLGIFGGARDPDTGYVIDPTSPQNTAAGFIEYNIRGHTFSRVIVADTTAQMILLGLSRFSGFFMYPAIVLVFWTKFRALQTFLANTPFVIFCISDTHRLHVYCGWIIFFDSCLHVIFHLTRWALQGNLHLLFGSASGITGFVVIVSTFLIVLPMTIFKKLIKFECRKYLHYLFWVFALAMCFHAPFGALPNAGFCGFIFPTLMIVYGLDAFYAKAFMSERIATVKYRTVKTGTQLTMKVSESFAHRLHSGGYVYICFDWMNKHQWHAFSIYENPTNNSERHVFIANNGDWTNAVHKQLQDRSTVRPVYISGPFPSPYANAVNYDNMVLVASGIGITPALSAIEAFRHSRRVNLIWATRDAAQLVFFLTNAKLDHKGFNLVFYTGTDPLPDSIENHHANANLSIIRSRPNLSHILVNIIAFVDKNSKNHHQHELDSEATSQTSSSLDGYWPQNNIDLDQSTNSHQRHSIWNTHEIIGADAEFEEEEEEAIIDLEKADPTFNETNIWKEDPASRAYVQSMPDNHMDQWGFCYCGGRNKLLESLVRESKELNIPLHEEAFDW